MFRKKKNAGAFDDRPSPEAPKPTTRTESVAQTNHEGTKRGRKYEVEPVKEANITWVSTKSEDPEPEDDLYPIPESDIDFYSVDTRIWKKVAWMIENSPGGGGGDAYDDTKLWEETEKLQGEIDALQGELDALTPDDYATKAELEAVQTTLQAEIDELKTQLDNLPEPSDGIPNHSHSYDGSVIPEDGSISDYTYERPPATFNYANSVGFSGGISTATDPTGTYYLYHSDVYYQGITGNSNTTTRGDWGGMVGSKIFAVGQQKWVPNPTDPNEVGAVRDFPATNNTFILGNAKLAVSDLQSARASELSVLSAILGETCTKALNKQGTLEWLCETETPKVKLVHCVELQNTKTGTTDAYYDAQEYREYQVNEASGEKKIKGRGKMFSLLLPRKTATLPCRLL